jgi:serine/threonine-protein kinase RsbW
VPVAFFLPAKIVGSGDRMSDSDPMVLTHSAPSLYEHLNAFANVLEAAVQKAGASEDEQVDLMVAVMEALNNAIDHGNGEDASKNVHMKIEIQPSSITVWVQDEGGGFDPGATPDPRKPENLMNESGRGMLMMRAFMDEVDFLPSQTGTQVKMIKYFSSNSSPSHR